MPAWSTFKGMLEGREQFERSDHGSWGRPQFRDGLGYLAYHDDLKVLVAGANADGVLAEAWEAYSDDTENTPLYKAMRGPVERLFSTDHPPANDGDLTARLTTFALGAKAAIVQVEGHLERPNGAILCIDVAVPSGLDAVYPDLALLDDQRQALIPLIAAMGRQTGTKSWSEWFSEKFAAVKDGIPALAKLGITSSLSMIINAALKAAAGHAVGLIGYTVMGFSGYVVTFGSNILTPWQATYEFPKLMKKQAVLYRLKEYGAQRLSLSSSNKVMKAIEASTDSIDWSAVQTAFKVTPFGLLVSLYGGAKWLALKAKPTIGGYYANAKDLIDAADTIHSGVTNENKLALLTILHLSGSLDKFIQIMTCRKEDAYSTLSGLIDI